MMFVSKCQKTEREVSKHKRNESKVESRVAVKAYEHSHKSGTLKKMQRKKETRKKPSNLGNQALQQQILQQIYGNPALSSATEIAATKQPTKLTNACAHSQSSIKQNNALTSRLSLGKKTTSKQRQQQLPIKSLTKSVKSAAALLPTPPTTCLENSKHNLHTLNEIKQMKSEKSIGGIIGCNSNSMHDLCFEASPQKTQATNALASKTICMSKSQSMAHMADETKQQQQLSPANKSIPDDIKASINPLNTVTTNSIINSKRIDQNVTHILSETQTKSQPALANANQQSKRKSNQVSTQQSEQKALGNYINTIISDFLASHGDTHLLQSDKLKFNGGILNLEGYAQRLVRMGIGFIAQEKIRIYRKNNQMAFLTLSDGKRQLCDAVITQRVARLYAFDGDIVRAFVLYTKEQTAAVKNENLPLLAMIEDTSDDYVESMIPKQCPKAFVIRIVQQPAPRLVVGTLCLQNTKILYGVRYFVLRPEDYRLPLLYVPLIWCNFNQHATHSTSKYYFLVEVVETTICGYCIGKLVKCLGIVGLISAEINAILASNGLHHIRPYDRHINAMWGDLVDEHVSTADLNKCMDLRDLCVFSIDPPNAQDIDDALSLEMINGKRIVVGVHIADVSKYLLEDTALDMMVRQRATSIYLGNEVIHMLPDGLCRKCSLYAGKERFVLSVFLVFDTSGNLIDRPKFMRSIIKSCAQLTYDDAQKIIDRSWRCKDKLELPIVNGKHNEQHIIGRVQLLHMIAQQLRKNRYASGALSINNPKLQFVLDKETGEPLSFQLEQRESANFLIEEFMLLANQAVARLIHAQFPRNAILRAHNPPLARPLQALRERLAQRGLHLDCSSAGTIYESIQRICQDANDPEAMLACLSSWLTKPMVRAMYLCSDGKPLEDLQHYALSIPIYTHFTSPIRRYADIMVHRLVAAALDLAPPPRRRPAELHILAEICNVQKYNAKCAAEDTANFMFRRYVQSNKKLQMTAVVIELQQRSLSVLLIKTGHVVSVYYDQQRQVQIDKNGLPQYILITDTAPSKPHKVEVFTKLCVEVKVRDNKLQAYLKAPINEVATASDVSS